VRRHERARSPIVPFLILLAGGCGHAHAAGPPVEVEPAPAVAAADEEAESPVLVSESAHDAPRPARAVGGQAHAPSQAAGDEPVAPAANSQKLIVSGSVTVRTVDVSALVHLVREHTAAAGGTVVSEQVQGNAEEGSAHMSLRLPPDGAAPFIDWLGSQATLESRALQATDVSRTFFDQALAIKNLQITMGRLQELAARPNTELKDVLEVERELTRVRGEIERLEGEHRLLGDRIARATLSVAIYPRRGAHPPDIHVEPELKFELVPHATVLHFLDDRSRAQTRGGGGVSLMFSRAFTLDFTALPRHDGDARSYLFSASVAGYSDFLGGGRRRYLNPYLGLRVGGGLINDHGTFSLGGEVGVELLHTKLFLIDLTGRVLGFIYGSGVPNDVVLEGVAGVGVPF
jgi:Domain of unknown function (DUF4349)